MARKKIRKKKKKQLQQVSQMFKTVNGQRRKFVKVNLKRNGKTITKQYLYRGGKFSTYLEEAKLPKGTKYHVNYKDNRIITNTRDVMTLIKTVKDSAKKKRKKGVKLPKKVDILKKLRIIPKKTYLAPTPLQAETTVNLLKGKVYYDREHSITEFNTMGQQDTFLTNIISKGTKNRTDARRLLHNFNKIRLKLSYAVVVEAINQETGEQVQLANFTAIGKKPLEIADYLKSVNLYPNDDFFDIYEDCVKPFKDKLQDGGVQVNKLDGYYKITDVRMAIKFYNNPQTMLK